MNLAVRLQAWFKANIQSIALWTILTTHGLLLARISMVNAPMYDEIAHLPSGLSHWKFSSFGLYRVNPPLMRMFATAPLLLANPQMDWNGLPDGPYSRPEFVAGIRFLQANGTDSFWYFTLCRWAQIPVSIFGGWICFRWARDLFGISSGFVALWLWCFCPNVLAWGSTLTPDLGAAAFGVAAGDFFWRWLCRPNLKSALLAGVFVGLAELSKSTWIVLFLLWPVLWLAWRLAVRTPLRAKPSFAQLTILLLIGLYLLNLGYCFEGSFQPLGQFQFICRALGGKDAHEVPGNRFLGTWMGTIPVPVPKDYLKGIDVQKYDFEKGKWSCLNGEQKLGGWYHYYLYGLIVKTPLGTLLILGLTIVLVMTGRGFRQRFCDELVLLAPAIAILLFVSCQTGFNRYLRYVLPAVPFLYVFASRAGRVFETRSLIPRALCGIGLAASLVGSLSTFPHSMSFFNLFAGGPFGGPRHLLDANIDWGQDLLELKRFADRHAEDGPIQLAYFGLLDPKLAGFPFELLSPSEMESKEVTSLKAGWYAISVNHLYGYRHFDSDTPAFTRFQQLKPDAMAGYSIYLYHLPAEQKK